MKNQTNLNNEVLNTVVCDYLTIKLEAFPQKEGLDELITELLKIKPNLIFYNTESKKYEQGYNYVEQNKSFFDRVVDQIHRWFNTQQSKSLQNKSKIDAFYVINRSLEKNPKTTAVLCIPSQFSHQVLVAILNRDIILSPKMYTITRLDLKSKIPGFTKTKATHADFFKLRQQLIDFEYIQSKKDETRIQKHSNKPRVSTKKREEFFLMVNFNKRGSQTRYLRIYLYFDVKENTIKSTFEVEIKKSLALKFSEVILTGDNPFFEFNRLAVKVLIEEINSLEQTEYTAPLIEWMQDLLTIQHEFFYENSIVPWESNRVKAQFVPRLKDFRTKKKQLYLSTNLYSLVPQVTNQNVEKFRTKKHHARIIMCLVFFAHQLILKWHKLPEKDVHQLINRWSDQDIRNTSFIDNKNYLISFQPAELLKFLNLSDSTRNRDLICSYIDVLWNTSVEFSVENYDYKQHLIYSYVAKRGSGGRKSNISLVVHPFIIRDIINQSLRLSIPFYKDFLTQVNNI